jgi:hypothetical protein
MRTDHAARRALAAADRTDRHLFAAQMLSLLGTGLATVALGLLAYEIAGADAGAVLGTALAIKIVAYVGLVPHHDPLRLMRHHLLRRITLAAIVIFWLEH